MHMESGRDRLAGGPTMGPEVVCAITNRSARTTLHSSRLPNGVPSPESSIFPRFGKYACTTAALILSTAAAFGQSIVEPDAVTAERKLFDTAPAEPLRCSIHSARPSLNYQFRFQTGYIADIPLAQFRGAGHRLIHHLRVTSHGANPVYLTKTENLPEVPATKVEAEAAGSFVTGEGAYGVDLLVEDDLHRSCRSSWQIQPRRTGDELHLRPVTPPGAVEELSAIPERLRGPRSGRITLLLHVTPFAANLTTLQPHDVEKLTATVGSLVEQLAPASVRLVAFSLDQRAVVFRKDSFDTTQIGDLTAAITHMQLAKIDFRTLQSSPGPIEMLSGLVLPELTAASPPDCIILIGPKARTGGDLSLDAAAKHPGSGPPLFYLEFQSTGLASGMMLSAGPGAGGARGVNRGGGMTPATDIADRSLSPVAAPWDAVYRLMHSLKADILAVSTPHEFAAAIHHIDSRIARSPQPAATPASPVAPPPSQAEAAPAATATTAAEPTADEDPSDLLVRLRDHVLRHATQIPNYTCVETIRRDRYEPVDGRAALSCDRLLARRKQPNFAARLQLERTDWLRLDVALVQAGEIYSWAGAHKFEDMDIDQLVPEGAIGTGSFASILLALFQMRNPGFVFVGPTASEGRRLFEYSFAVPKAESTYRAKTHPRDWVITGYSGSLLVNPATAELVRLVIRTDELPPETEACETDTKLEYGSVQLGGSGYTLPTAAQQRFIDRDGAEAENIMRFSACREFQAESTVAFDGGAAAARNPGAASDAPLLPDGLPVVIELITPVRPAQSAAGDRIEGKLAKAILDERRHILIPEGAAVEGRLMRVEFQSAPRPTLTVALRWERVQVAGAMVPIALRPDRRLPQVRPGYRGVPIDLPLPGEDRFGVYHFFGSEPASAPNFRTEWITSMP